MLRYYASTDSGQRMGQVRQNRNCFRDEQAARQDDLECRSLVVNPECSKDYTINGISKYLYQKVHESLILRPRMGCAKFGNRSEQLKEVFGHYSQALTYALVTYPKEGNLGDRRAL